MAQALNRIAETSFLLGYNDRDKPEDIRRPDDNVVYMALIKNAFIEENKIIQRNGYVTIGNVPAAKKILGQDRHEPAGGSKYILRARNNAGDTNAIIEGWSGSGNWTALVGATTQTANAIHSFVTAQSATYIFNTAGDPVLKTTDGVNASVVAAIPQGIDGAWFHNYFFVFGVAGNLDRLYFSDVNTPETYDPINGYIDVNPGDNEPITAIDVLGDQLLIFKNSRVWGLTGFGTADFTLDDLGERVTNIGTPALKGTASTGNDCYFISYRGAVPHIRSMKRTEENNIIDGGIISDAITGTMKRINKSQLAKVALEFDGRKLWCAIPTGTSTENNEIVVLDTLTGGWTLHTGIYAADLHVSTISGAAELYHGDSRAVGKSYQLNTGANDDGVAVDFEVYTPYYSPQPGYQSRYKYLYITGDSDQDSQLDIDYSIDGFTFNNLATVDMTGLGAIYGQAIFGISKFGATQLVKKRVDWAGGTAYFIQYRFSNSELNKQITLREWEIFYQNRGLRSTPN